MRERWKAYFTLLGGLFLIGFVGCGGQVEQQDVRLGIPLALSPQLLASTASLGTPSWMEVLVINQEDGTKEVDETFDVTADDFAIGEKVVWIDGVPVEVDLEVKVSIYDEDDLLLYQGSDVIYISAGETGEAWVQVEYMQWQ